MRPFSGLGEDRVPDPQDYTETSFCLSKPNLSSVLDLGILLESFRVQEF